MNLAMLCGGFPPDFDAIGHYTWHLGNELTRQGHGVTIYTSDKNTRSPTGKMQVYGAFDPASPETLRSLPGLIKQASTPLDWLIVQYNPFSFGPRGYCPQLVSALKQVKEHSGVRIATMFHETFVPWWPLKFAVMRTWQQPVFSRLCAVTDRAFVSTLRWMPAVESARRNLPCQHLPVGSNVDLNETTETEARQKLSIAPETFVIGIFGQAHVSRPPDLMAAAVRAVKIRRPDACVLYVGPDGDKHRTLCEGIPFIDAGVYPQESLGICLRAMNFLLSPFADGASTRRGSVMAALQHGLPVASTQAEWSDDILTDCQIPSLLFTKRRDAEGFAADVAAWQENLPANDSSVRQEIATFYREHFSWKKIAQRLLLDLNSENREKSGTK